MLRQSDIVMRRAIRPTSTFAGFRCFSTRPSYNLWNGITVPYENQKIPVLQNGQQTINVALPMILSKTQQIESIHRKFVEDLLLRAAAAPSGLDVERRHKASSVAAQPRHRTLDQNSLLDLPLFRTDGPLTPYPIELDSGEVLEPKHATLVRIMDKQGEERNIVVAEIEEESGKHRRVLLSVDLEQYQDARHGPIGRRVTAEEMYASLDLSR